MNEKQLVTWGFALGLSILAVIAGISYMAITGFKERAGWVEHTYLVLEKLENAFSHVKDAEASQRGFIITGEDRYLEPYYAVITIIDNEIVELRRLTADNPSQQPRLERLERLAKERIATLESAIKLKKADPRSGAAEEIVRSGKGKAIMDEIRGLVAEIKGHENALLLGRSRESEASARNTMWAIIVGNGVSFAILLVVFGLLKREITQRKKAQDAAEKYADEIEDLYNNAPCGYHSADKDGVFVRMNDTELSWLGYTREEVIGKMRHPDIMTPESVKGFHTYFPLFKERGWLSDVEFEYIRKDGTILPVSLSATVVKDNAGNYLMGRSNIFDITERKRAEEQIKTLNADLERRAALLEATNKELESFSYSVSHDLRAPLRAIDGFARIVEEDYQDKLDDEGKRLLKVIRDNSEKMGRLIDDLLAFSRLGRQPVTAAQCDMSAIAQEVFNELLVNAADKPVYLDLKSMPPAWGDRSLLRQVWVNLLSNGIKYSNKNAEPAIEAGGYVNGAENIYYVKDNGAGFDMQYYDKLFGVFQRLHSADEFQGTGVGLAIVQRVVTRHGGRVWAEGKMNKGAAFYFALPKGEVHG